MKKEQIQDLAIQYATEGLDTQQEASLEKWLKSANTEEKDIFTEMVDTCATVAVASQDEVTEPKALKGILLDKIKHNGEAASYEKPDVMTLRKEDQEWINLPIKGAMLLELSARKEDGFVVSMIEVAPGSEFPEHDHHGVEMAYILEGDLKADGVTLYAGDFFRADAGTHHGTHFSPSGCRALIVTANENYRHNTVKALGGIQKVYRKVKKALNI